MKINDKVEISVSRQDIFEIIADHFKGKDIILDENSMDEVLGYKNNNYNYIQAYDIVKSINFTGKRM